MCPALAAGGLGSCTRLGPLPRDSSGAQHRLIVCPSGYLRGRRWLWGARSRCRRIHCSTQMRIPSRRTSFLSCPGVSWPRAMPSLRLCRTRPANGLLRRLRRFVPRRLPGGVPAPDAHRCLRRPAPDECGVYRASPGRTRRPQPCGGRLTHGRYTRDARRRRPGETSGRARGGLLLLPGTGWQDYLADRAIRVSEVRGRVRVSFGLFTSEEDIDVLVHAISDRLRHGAIGKEEQEW